MKTISLGELLSDAQIAEVDRFFNQYRQHPDEATLLRNLKEFFGTFKEHLLTKGIVSDYLAYMVLHLFLTTEQAAKDEWDSYKN